MGKRALTLSHIIEWVSREADRVPFGSVHVRSDYVRNLIFEHAINGDESFAEPLIVDLFWKVVHDKIGHQERAMLAFVLERLMKSEYALKTVSGVEKRGGQVRRGWIGLSISAEVATMMGRDGLTAEQAWELAGERNHLTASAVKNHWIRWKPTLIESAAALICASNPELSAEEIQVRARVVVLGARV